MCHPCRAMPVQCLSPPMRCCGPRRPHRCDIFLFLLARLMCVQLTTAALPAPFLSIEEAHTTHMADQPEYELGTLTSYRCGTAHSTRHSPNQRVDGCDGREADAGDPRRHFRGTHGIQARSTRDCPSVIGTCTAGAAFGLLCCNSAEEVQALIDRLGIANTADTPICITSPSTVPAHLSVRGSDG